MIMHHECLLCNLKQVYRIIKISGRTDQEARRLVTLTMELLSKVDYSKTNSEIMGETWRLITKEIGIYNPYEKVKEQYNRMLLQEEEKLRNRIMRTKNPLHSAVRLSAIGNAIDFAGRREVEFVLEDVYKGLEMELAIDHSEQMFRDLGKAKQLLYLGDNCGEIVLDKLLLEEIQKNYPGISITYGVRGIPIINDVTLEDAKMAGIDTVAEILENGSGALGTVFEDTSNKFQTVFEEADLVISKGQGNFESISECNSSRIYYIMMVKCERIADIIGAPQGALVCMKNNRKM